MNCDAGCLEKLREEPSTGRLLKELDLARVKKSGLFLDNLKIFLSGFSENDQVLLTRVLKFAGATRYGYRSLSNCTNTVPVPVFTCFKGLKCSVPEPKFFGLKQCFRS